MDSSPELFGSYALMLISSTETVRFNGNNCRPKAHRKALASRAEPASGRGASVRHGCRKQSWRPLPPERTPCRAS